MEAKSLIIVGRTYIYYIEIEMEYMRWVLIRETFTLVLKLLFTLTRNSSAESQEPIFNNAVKAGAAAEPNSRAEANKGSN